MLERTLNYLQQQQIYPEWLTYTSVLTLSFSGLKWSRSIAHIHLFMGVGFIGSNEC